MDQRVASYPAAVYSMEVHARWDSYTVRYKEGNNFPVDF